MDVTPDRWQRVDALFNAALDLPEDRRIAFVATEAADDAELRRQVTEMIAHATAAGGRIAGLIERAARAAGDAAPWTGRRFGPYRIVREIGRGGMGLVFEAVRDDDAFEKRVAVKVAAWWRDTATLQERFKIERQILAGLEHPYIARLIDGGTSDGVPYFVMEYVEGKPITEYCSAPGVTVEARIDLFRKVCTAVRFAHENLIVHRDLKPGNILVGPDGEPKLLDFGIAKILAGATGDGGLTRDGCLTPDYASPEQIQGRTITVRTDVYALGLILYELLTGTRAQTSDTSSPAALDRSVCEVDPPLASEQAAGHAALARRLRGDLDTILQMAIRKEPERRYETVAAFSDDLGRHLNGRPVVARPSTVRYRAAKFLTRHRAGVAAAALVLVSIVAGFVATLHQARRAERRFQQVRALANTVVFDVHDQLQSLPGSTAARAAIVQTALTYLESLRSDIGDDEALALELATAYQKVGNAQGNPLTMNLGDTAGALVSLGRAADLLSPLAARGSHEARVELASVYFSTAAVLRAKGDAAGTIRDFDRARTSADLAIDEQPSDRRAVDLGVHVYTDVSRAEFELRHVVPAQAAARRAMELARRLVDLDPANRHNRDQLASAYNALGATEIAAGRLREAATNRRAAVAIREQLVVEEPNNTEFRRNLLVNYGSLGDVLGFRIGENLGDVPGAIAAYTRAMELATFAHEHDPSDVRAMFDLASARLRLGSLYVDAQRFDEAMTELEAAAKLNSPLLAHEPTSDRFGIVAVAIDRRLADALAATGRRGDAVAHLQKALTVAEPLIAGPSGPTARQHFLLATARLAALYAEIRDPRAGKLADRAAAELARAPAGNAAVTATIQRDLERANAKRTLS